MTKSTHTAEVIDISNAESVVGTDNLAFVRNGFYTIVLNKNDWQGKNRAVHILPESLVFTGNPAFRFLSENDEWKYVSARKIRGVVSHGFLVPVPDGDFNLGDDVADILGIKHYDPEEEFNNGVSINPPIYLNKYDVESGLKYWRHFHPDETVVVTEKIHGSNWRATCINDTVYIGSRNQWKPKDKFCKFWQPYFANQSLDTLLKQNPGKVFYGELFGNVASLKYGMPNSVDVRLFDVYDAKEQRFMDFEDATKLVFNSTPYPDKFWVPILYHGKLNDELRGMCEGNSVLCPTHIREGIVIAPAKERIVEGIGRLKLKIVNPEYLKKQR